MNSAFTRTLILAVGLPFPAAHIVLGLANLHQVTVVWPVLIAMAICLGLMLLVTLQWEGNRLTPRQGLIMVAGIIVMELLVQSVLPVGKHPGYAAWQCGAIQMLMVTLAIRNQIGLAWLGIGLFVALDFTASMIHRLSAVDALAMVVPPAMWMVVATAVSLVLLRCQGQIRAYETKARESSARLAREHARTVFQDEWALDLDRSARRLLEKIASGKISDTVRTDCLLLEAQLRDQIRGRALATPEVLQAARAARKRGVRVDIFDDRGTDLPPVAFSEATAQLAGALTRAERGSVKGRALPSESEVAVTILAFDEDAPGEEFYIEILAPPPAGNPMLS
jgi:hypothetical protein